MTDHMAVCATCGHRFQEHQIHNVKKYCNRYEAGAGEFARCRCPDFTARKDAA